MTNSAADVSDGQMNTATSRPRQREVEQRMFSSEVSENLRESREGSEVRQGIAGCSPVSVEGVSWGATICPQKYSRNANRERLLSMNDRLQTICPSCM